LAEKIALSDPFAAENPKVQSQNLASLLVEQRIGILAVFCTPLLERKIRRTLFRAENQDQNVSRETMAILGLKRGPKTAETEGKIRPSPRVQSQNLASLLVEQRIGISAVLSTPLIELPIQKPPLFVA